MPASDPPPKNLTQSSRRDRQQPLTAFEADTGRSALAAGTAESAPFQSLLEAPRPWSDSALRRKYPTVAVHADRTGWAVQTEGLTMSLRINDEAPNFTTETTQGSINFHDFIGNGWAILFSHPKDFTPVCTTELGYMAGMKPEFDKRGCKIIGLSVDPVEDHTRWQKDIEETQGHKVTYPLIGDPELKVAKLYDMLPAEAGDTSQGRTAATNATVRSVFVIGPDKKVKAMLTYPMSTGRNFDEVLRIVDSCQLTSRHTVATPVNWKPGDDVIVAPAIPTEEAKLKFPSGFREVRPYLRYTHQPN
jgi:alkyl hydroperoxide reductase subunit AhpC